MAGNCQDTTWDPGKEPSQDHHMISDSGASASFLPPPAPFIQATYNDSINITQPNGEQLTSTYEGIIDNQLLRREARKAYLVPQLKKPALLSIPTVCDANYDVLFTKEKVYVKNKQGVSVVTGERNPSNKLWAIPINETTTKNTCNAMTCLHRNSLPITLPPGNLKTQQKVHQIHQTMFIPTPITLHHAVKAQHLNYFPEITHKDIANHLYHTPASLSGHMVAPRQHTHNNKEKEGLIYTDLTGIVNNQHAMYLYITFHVETNVIFALPLRNRHAETITRTYQHAIRIITDGGFIIRKHIMDNEAADAVSTVNKRNNIITQRVPPHSHRANAAERSIKTFKAHWLAGLATAPKSFPIKHWVHLLTQCNITLNLIRTSNTKPEMSAHQHLWGTFDFN